MLNLVSDVGEFAFQLLPGNDCAKLAYGLAKDVFLSATGKAYKLDEWLGGVALSIAKCLISLYPPTKFLTVAKNIVDALSRLSKFTKGAVFAEKFLGRLSPYFWAGSGGGVSFSCGFSSDPNDKAGPTGVGAQRHLAGDQGLSYLIQFENKPDATLPAQTVRITDQLDKTKVDFDTFSLGPISFNDKFVTPPSGLSEWTTDVDLRPANNLLVRIAAKLDKDTGMLTWLFDSIDPATGQPTENGVDGFLPPNKEAPEGQGSVFFTVMPKAELGTATEIRNFATIYFDANAAILTPEWLNTVDRSKPASHVLPLAAQQDALDFNVAWTGTDAGSGVLNYSIYVSEKGGPFKVWQANTTATSATFTGQPDTTYAFYSVARDQTYNIEETPTTPDASTLTREANAAPVLDNTGSMSLSAINEDDTTNNGTKVSDMIASAQAPHRITDINAGAVEGIAVTTVDNSNGTWQYSINGGTDWNNFETPSETAARLLAADDNTRLRFVPNSNFNGNVSGITFRAWDRTSGVNDENGDTSTNGGTSAFSTDTETASITVTADNDKPNAAVNPTGLTMAEDAGPQTVTLSGSDVETAAADLTFTITQVPAYGTLKRGDTTLVQGATFTGSPVDVTYQPALDYNGTDSFKFTASDTGDPTGNAANVKASDEVTVEIVISSVNDAPSFTKGADHDVNEDAEAQTITGWATGISTGSANEIGQAVAFIVSNNNPALFVVPPAISDNGTLTYQPAANKNGVATVIVKVHDDGGIANGGQDTSATQTFNLTVRPVNDKPVATDGTAVTSEDSEGVAISLSELVADVETLDKDLTYEIIQPPAATTGVLSGQGANRVFKPALNFNGPVTFTYQVTDTGDGSSAALSSEIKTVAITVTEVNDAPIAANDAATTPADTSVSIAVLTNDSDVDGDTLSVLAVTPGAKGGTVQINADHKSVSFTPGDGYLGADSFTYTVSDSQGGTATATVNVTVTLPSSTVGAKVTGSGGIGSALFNVNAMLQNNGELKGNVNFDDSRNNRFVRSTQITAILANSTTGKARIFGKATLNGEGSHSFVLDVVDKGEPGNSDEFRLVVNGAVIANGVITRGNIQVHKIK